MKLTIILEDGAVYKNNISYSGLDLSNIPSNVHALQWNETKGWIEYVNENGFEKKPNENITQLPEWVDECLNKWEAAKQAQESYMANLLTIMDSMNNV